MESMDRLTELRENGTMQWSGEQRAWVAEPDAVVSALAHDGFEEYQREIARCGHDRAPAGGVWQGLNSKTGAVASAIWVRADTRAGFPRVPGRQRRDLGGDHRAATRYLGGCCRVAGRHPRR